MCLQDHKVVNNYYRLSLANYEYNMDMPQQGIHRPNGCLNA